MAHEAFLQAILHEPDEEAHRLVYADWLMERGDPRGEFIHIQCLLHRWHQGVGDWVSVVPELARLRRREQELLATHREEWQRPFRPMVRAVEFRRGFVEGLRLSGAELVAHGARLFALAPIRSLSLFEVYGPTAEALAGSEFLNRVESLETVENWSQRLTAQLESLLLTGLRRLKVRSPWWHSRWTEELASWPGLARLSCLDLGEVRALTPEAVLRLLQAPNFSPHCTLRFGASWPPALERVLALGPSLGVVRDPALLRKLLRLAASDPEPFAHRPLRELAREAFSAPATVPVLAQALNAADRQRRAAAVLLLGRLGAAAVPAVPDLLRRLYEADASLRSHTAAALAGLLPHLPPRLITVMGWLANPVQTAETNLRRAIEDAPLTDVTWLTFAHLCSRRLTWWTALHPPEIVNPYRLARLRSPMTTRNPLWLLRIVDDMLQCATDPGARQREAAWLLARFCEVILCASN